MATDLRDEKINDLENPLGFENEHLLSRRTVHRFTEDNYSVRTFTLYKYPKRGTHMM
jgi:hypothetical protein